MSGAERVGAVVGDLYPLAADTIARAEAIIAAHGETWRNPGAGCRCGWTCRSCPPGAERTRHATHVVQVLAGAGLLASLAHLDEPRPVDAPAPRPARRTTPFAASGGLRVFSDGGC